MRHRPLSAALIALALIIQGCMRSLDATKQNAGLDRQAAPEQLSASALRADLSIARAALEEGHSGLYRYTSKAVLDRLFERESRSFDRRADAFAIYRSLSRIVAAIKDGHTSAGLPDSLRTEMNNRALLLPLEVRVLQGRLYVLRDYAHSDSRLAGSEITAINGVPARKILADMLDATPADGDIPTARARAVSSWRFNRILWSLALLRSPFVIDVVDPSGNRSRIPLAGMEQPRLMSAARTRIPQDERQGDPTALTFLPDQRTALMRISSFEGPLTTFLDESFRAMLERGTTTLILDLRNNGGGRDVIGRILYSYIALEPFRYYRDLTMNALQFEFMKYVAEPELPGPRMLERDTSGRYHGVGHANWGIHAAAVTNSFSGRVFVLINGGCQSGCAEFSSIAHHHRRATFIGEETGGGYDGNTSGFTAVVTLPNTRAVLVIPLMSYYMAVGDPPVKGRGVMPDHVVTYTIGELIDGVDKERDLALRLAGTLP